MAARSSRGSRASARISSCDPHLACAMVSSHSCAGIARRLQVGESTVIRGPSGTGTSMNPASSPVLMAPPPPKARCHGSTGPSRSSSSEATRLFPCLAPLNQWSRTCSAYSLCRNGSMPPTWSLSMWVTTATSMCRSSGSSRGHVPGGPPSTSMRQGCPLWRAHSTSRQSPSRAGMTSMRMAVFMGSLSSSRPTTKATLVSRAPQHCEDRSARRARRLLPAGTPRVRPLRNPGARLREPQGRSGLPPLPRQSGAALRKLRSHPADPRPRGQRRARPLRRLKRTTGTDGPRALGGPAASWLPQVSIRRCHQCRCSGAKGSLTVRSRKRASTGSSAARSSRRARARTFHAAASSSVRMSSVGTSESP